VARRAGVDPALVRHYFGTKSDLFAVINELPGRPGDLLGRVLDTGGPEDIGRRLVAMFFSVWDTEVGRQRMRALIAAASSSGPTGGALAEFLTAELIGAIAPRLAGEQRELRAELIAANVVGLAMVRYVLHLEPLASASEETIARWLAPNIQRLLDGGP